jgi:S1-C subfamily serine protease
MATQTIRWGVLVPLLTLFALTSARADRPPKAGVVKRGKAATVLVEITPANVSGTAFCVHHSGLFVTNEHVVRPAGTGEVRLVLDSGLKSQKVLTARVARADKDLDLALLRVEGARDLPSLPLGSVSDLAELQDVFTFGFPFGRFLAPDRKEYPAISVNVGSVSALRRKAGALYRIDLDASLNPGNSGSPVLDESGKVVGVVVQGLSGGAHLSQAIPVSHLARFLAAPDFQFTPPPLTRTNLNRPVEFKVRVVSVFPAAQPLSVRLLLGAGQEKERAFIMQPRDGAFVVAAVPVPPRASSAVELSARFGGGGAVTGSVADRPIQVGGRALKLSALSRLEFRPRSVAVLADGKTTLEGAVTGLDAVEILIGGQRVTLDLSRATAVEVQGALVPAEVACTFVAEREGKEVARLRTTIPVLDAVRILPGDLSLVAIRPPPLAEEKVVKGLPEPYDDMAVGGGGRYLIFHLPRLRKLAVFDVNEARVTHYIPLAEDRVRFAAGLDKLVIGLSGKGAVERWSLSTFEREMTAFPESVGDVSSVIMGSASNGPVAVNGLFLDLQTLRPLPIKYPSQGPVAWGPTTRIPTSADGTVYGAWKTNYSPGESIILVLEGNELKRYEAGELGHIVPGPDGRVLYTAKGPVSNRFTRLNPWDDKLGYCLPATQGSYFLSLTSAEGDNGGGLSVYLLGHQRPVARLDRFGHGLRFDGWDREDYGAWKRIFLIPQANLIVVLPAANDRVVLHRFDIDRALEKSGIDYLVVTSRPPPTARRGSVYTYQVAVKSRYGGVKFRLDSGPGGMEVSPAGLVRWPVPAEGKEAESEVILTVSDSAGQEVFHTFTVRAVTGSD